MREPGLVGDASPRQRLRLRFLHSRRNPSPRGLRPGGGGVHGRGKLRSRCLPGRDRSDGFVHGRRPSSRRHDSLRQLRGGGRNPGRRRDGLRPPVCTHDRVLEPRARGVGACLRRAHIARSVRRVGEPDGPEHHGVQRPLLDPGFGGRDRTHGHVEFVCQRANAPIAEPQLDAIVAVRGERQLQRRRPEPCRRGPEGFLR